MRGYMLNRFGGTILVLFIVSVFTFGFVRMRLGDPARLLAEPHATLHELELVRQPLGLDKPIWQ